MRAVVYGTGATGARAARQLASAPDIESLALVDDNDAVLDEVVASLGPPARAEKIDSIRPGARFDRFRTLCEDADVVVLAADDDHVDLARTALEASTHVISVSDDVDTVKKLQAFDAHAIEVGRNVVVGTGFSPGLTCLLAVHAARNFDVVDEVHVAKFGTGGPACARQHHRALRADALDWHNRQWESRRGGSGRELCWFPDPVGGLDCYQAALPETLLLLPSFPQLVRSTARVAATRRDRSTKWLPMLRKPHPEGLVGAVRVEVRGWAGSVRDAIILGVLDRPAVAAGTVAAIAAQSACAGRFSRHGSSGLASLVDDPLPFLQELARLGVKAARFEGLDSEELSFRPGPT